MSVDSPMALVLALAVVTLLGIIMGYCLGLLRNQHRARRAIDDARRDLVRRQEAMEVDLASARTVVNDQREAMARDRAQVQKATRRESALEVHSQLQAQRIQTLESQLRAFEDQQIRLKRDFARYKADKNHEMELLRNRVSDTAGTAELPVLQKRILDTGSRRGHRTQGARHDAGADTASGALTDSRLPRGLGSSLSRELEIPALAESELPDSLEDLEFELPDKDGAGDLNRG